MHQQGALALALILCMCTTVHSAAVSGRMNFANIEDKHNIVGSTVSLNNGMVEDVVRADGTFVLNDVEPGVYSMIFETQYFVFPKFVVEVKSDDVVRVLQEVGGGERKTVRYPLLVEPLGRVGFFAQRKQMSIYSMFANPMGIMMLITLVMVVVFPRMMDQLDPEEMKKIQEEMGGGGQDPQKMIANLFGGAQKSNDEDSD